MDRLSELRSYVQAFDRDLTRKFDFVVDEVRDSGATDVQYEMRGHAAVFNQWSLDLGGFRERLLPGAFDDVLERDPHVVHVWDHDTRFVLSSTRNGTLELKADQEALHYRSRVAPTSYAKDLGVLLRRGDIDQSSFAFTVEEDEWRIVQEGDQDVIERDVRKVRGLFDVTTTAMGAYPQTTSELAVRSLARGFLPPAQTTAPVMPVTVTSTMGDATITTTGLAVVTPPEETGERAAIAAADKGTIEELKRQAEAATMLAKQRLLRGRQ